MKTLIVAKAESSPSMPVDDCVIHINNSIPDFKGDDYVEKSLVFFEVQATVIVDALQTHLHGGTLDAVMRELCKRKACLFRVPIGI